MKTLAKQIAIFLILVLLSLNTKAQFYEYEMDSVSFSNQTNYEFYTTCDSDSLVTIKGVNGEDLVVKTVKISFWIAQDSYFDKDHILVELQTLKSYNSNKSDWVEEKISMDLIDEDNEHEFGVGTFVVIGERDNGEWFMYAWNSEKNLYSFHFIDLNNEKDIII